MGSVSTITLKVNPTTISLSTLTVATGDFGYTIPFVVQDSTGTALNISTYTVTLKAWLPATPTVFVINDATTQDVPASGTCHYVTVDGDLATAGIYLAQLVLTKAGEELSTEQFAIIVQTNASSYCALADVKAVGSLNITGTTSDAMLAKYIASASREIDRYCHRSFAAVSETRYFDGAADRLIIDDLVTITSIALDTDGDGDWETTLAATDYLLYPYNETPKWRVDLSHSSTRSDFAEDIPKGVQIVGLWGYQATIPDDIAQACLEMVCRIYRQAQAGFGTVVGTPDIGTGMVYQGLSSDIKRKLDDYVRHVYA